jgi:hypothetical protein
MNAPKTPQIGSERCAGPLAGMAVDLAAAIAVIIARPLMHAMPDSGMRWMAPPVALPLIGIELGAVSGDVLRDQGRAGMPLSLVANPEARLTGVPRDDTDNGWTIVGVGPVPSPLIGPPTRRIVRGRMGCAVFPPRIGTARRPQRRCPAWPQSGRSRSRGLGYAAARDGAVGVTASTRVPGGPWVHPSQSRAATVPGSLAADGSSRRRYRLARCHSPRSPDTGRPENGPGHGTAADGGSRSAGILSLLGGGGVPARGCSGHRPTSRFLGSRSYWDLTTCCTVATYEPKFYIQS